MHPYRNTNLRACHAIPELIYFSTEQPKCISGPNRNTEKYMIGASYLTCRYTIVISWVSGRTPWRSIRFSLAATPWGSFPAPTVLRVWLFSTAQSALSNGND